MKGLHDCRHMTAELDPAEQRAAAEKLARLRMIELLGDKYVLSRANSPVKGRYHERTGAKLP